MSEENVEVVRRLVAAVNAHDFEGYSRAAARMSSCTCPGVGQPIRVPRG